MTAATMPASDHYDSPRPRTQNPMLDDANRFKIAVFCANVARGTSVSFADTLPKATWEESRRLGIAADRAGLDGFIPLSRWKNNTRSRPEDERILEPFTWAAGVGAVTERIAVFATVHMPLMHPIMFASMSSTIDHISSGRFGVNVVAGFNQPEFDMFGKEQLPHDERYVFADEWMRYVKKIWTTEDPFDWDGTYFKGAAVTTKPLPIQRPYPALMSAGASPAGKVFAATHADLNFVHLPDLDSVPGIVADVQAKAEASVGHSVNIFAGGYMVCADTEKEAWDRYRATVRDSLDRATASAILDQLSKGGAQSDHGIQKQERLERVAAGFYALPLVGTAEQIAEGMLKMSEAGMAGIAISFHDYDEGIQAYDEAVRPLLIESGLRTV